jgi:broad specificity phosphatase PhoE
VSPIVRILRAMSAAPAARARRIYLVRHGETERSARHLYSGQADVPLTDEGRRQAVKAGERLARTGVDAIWSSPLRRARDTAEAIASATGVPVTVDERLIEVDYGELEGLDRERGSRRFGAAFDDWRSDPFNHPLPKMEPLGKALARARDATADALAGGQCPVLVGHQGILRLVLVALGQVEADAYFSTRLDEAEPLEIEAPAIREASRG